jgi:hypothetical protein
VVFEIVVAGPQAVASFWGVCKCKCAACRVQAGGGDAKVLTEVSFWILSLLLFGGGFRNRLCWAASCGFVWGGLQVQVRCMQRKKKREGGGSQDSG